MLKKGGEIKMLRIATIIAVGAALIGLSACAHNEAKPAAKTAAHGYSK